MWCRASTTTSCRCRLASPTARRTPGARTKLHPADFTGDIALIQRGTCFFYEKIANAVEAGAEAVIIFNEGNSEERSGPDFGSASVPQHIPVIEMSAEASAAARGRSSSKLRPPPECGTVTLTVARSTVSEIRESENVIAETTTGRTDRVVVSGAHLDSVFEGPGRQRQRLWLCGATRNRAADG